MLLACASVWGCGPTEEEQQRIADRAVKQAQAQAEKLRDKLRGAYDSAYKEGRKIALEVGAKANDEILEAKTRAAFKLLKALDSSKIEVRVTKGVIFLGGTTRTEQERMMAEGLAYGITGDGKRVRSTITVPK